MKKAGARSLVAALVVGTLLGGAACSVYSTSLLAGGGAGTDGPDAGFPGLDGGSIPDRFLLEGGPKPDVRNPNEPPSCVSGVTSTCGPDMTVDCCTTLPVAGGTFLDTLIDGGQIATSVGSFSLDKYEVTVGRFRAFVSAGKGTQASPPTPGSGASPHAPGSGWDASWNTSLAAQTGDLENALGCSDDVGPTWTDVADNDEALPINCVTWFEAFAFCAWDHARLPSSPEWGYAAAGGSQGRFYPWSAPATSTSINVDNANYACNAAAMMIDYYDAGADADLEGFNFICSSLSDITPPGHYSPNGDGRWGQADLAGNMFEWVFDDCAQCADGGATMSIVRLLHGGGYDYPAEYLANDTFVWDDPLARFDDNGFRCARD